MLFHLSRSKCFRIYLKFETKRGSLVFLSGSDYYAFVCFFGCKDMLVCLFVCFVLFLHQSETVLILFCNVTSISFRVFSCVKG